MPVLPLLLTLLGGSAAAHPLGTEVAAQEIRLEVSGARARVRYQAEVPDIFVATAPGATARDPFAAMRTELASGLVLVADGASLPLHPEGTAAEPQRSSEHTWRLVLDLEAELPPDVRQLALTNGNLQDARNVFRREVRLGPSQRLERCSLARVDGDEVRRDDDGRWTRAADGRSVELVLGPRRSALERFLRPAPEARTCAEALDEPPLRRGLVGAVVGAGVLALALLLSRRGAARAPAPPPPAAPRRARGSDAPPRGS